VEGARDVGPGARCDGDDLVQRVDDGVEVDGREPAREHAGGKTAAAHLGEDRLRHRYLALLFEAMKKGGEEPLPGAPPTWSEMNERWAPRG
jgi:hypothetical protein